jgi:hypothetical protein
MNYPIPKTYLPESWIYPDLPLLRKNIIYCPELVDHYRAPEARAGTGAARLTGFDVSWITATVA